MTGIGFLGAGAIIRSGVGVSGLTTAATIWVAAGLGMLAGVGAFGLAAASAVFTIVALILPHRWLRRGRGLSVDDEDHDWPTGDRRRHERSDDGS